MGKACPVGEKPYRGLLPGLCGWLPMVAGRWGEGRVGHKSHSGSGYRKGTGGCCEGGALRGRNLFDYVENHIWTEKGDGDGVRGTDYPVTECGERI